jgi:hypothetical protein
MYASHDDFMFTAGCDQNPWFIKCQDGNMLKEKRSTDVDELLAKAKKPSVDAMQLHPFYREKIETALKCAPVISRRQ